MREAKTEAYIYHVLALISFARIRTATGWLPGDGNGVYIPSGSDHIDLFFRDFVGTRPRATDNEHPEPHGRQ
jgi:hypothetical protein